MGNLYVSREVFRPPVINRGDPKGNPLVPREGGWDHGDQDWRSKGQPIRTQKSGWGHDDQKSKSKGEPNDGGGATVTKSGLP